MSKQLNRLLSGYVTTKQAAEMMGVVQTSINHLLQNGRIKGVKVGREWLVSQGSIQDYLENKSPSGRPRSGTPQLETQQ